MLIYADVGPFPGNSRININLLSDDRVEYAELNQLEEVVPCRDSETKSQKPGI